MLRRKYGFAPAVEVNRERVDAFCADPGQVGDGGNARTGVLIAGVWIHIGQTGDLRFRFVRGRDDDRLRDGVRRIGVGSGDKAIIAIDEPNGHFNAFGTSDIEGQIVVCSLTAARVIHKCNVCTLFQGDGTAALYNGNITVRNLCGIECGKLGKLRRYAGTRIGDTAVGVLAVIRAKGDGQGGDFHIDGQGARATGFCGGIGGEGGLTYLVGLKLIILNGDDGGISGLPVGEGDALNGGKLLEAEPYSWCLICFQLVHLHNKWSCLKLLYHLLPWL